MSLQAIEEEQPRKSLAALSFSALQNSWKYKYLVPTVAATLITHIVYGPPVESWPLSTNLFTAIVRKNDQNKPKYDPTKPPRDPATHWAAVRKNLEAWSAEAKDGSVADVEIPVRKYGLGGVLEEFDEVEDGTRVVEAEWVAHDTVVAAGASASNRVLLYFHGGGYIMMSAKSHRALTTLLSESLNCRVLSVNYRLAPESPFPAGLHDAVASYFYLTKDLGIPAANIFVGGDSAGGGLSTAFLLYLRDQKLPSIGGAILISPWVDLTSSFTSWETNAHLDYLGPTKEDSDKALEPPRLYLGKNYDTLITHPYVTSYAADLSSLPPLLIQAGAVEALRDDSILLAQRAATAGVNVTLEIFDGGIHVSQAFGGDIAFYALKAVKQWASRQVQPVQHDFATVDAALVIASAARPKKAAGKATPSVKHVPIFVFTPIPQDPAPIQLRASANPLVRKVVEENNRNAPKGITSFYAASRAPGSGVVRRILGSFHL